MTSWRSACVSALIVACALLVTASRADAQGFIVVVNTAGPSTLSKDDVARIFLKKSTQLVPIDQDRDATVRSTFSKAVIGRSLQAVVSYWQQQIFSGGEAPPTERGSDEEVLAFVRANARAIGYVNAGTNLGDGVKALKVE
jgi:ABC-type phosphate transport system substrate-binding protein